MMAATHLTRRLSPLSLSAASGIWHHATQSVIAASATSAFTVLPLVRTCHVYRDPNYKYFKPIFNFKQKHYDPKTKRDRKLKFIKVELPNFDDKFDAETATPEELRAKMKEKGIQPVRPWQEKPTYVSSTVATFEPYVPPEGDGKVSTLSAAGAKQRVKLLEKKGTSMMAVRKIRQFDDDFDPKIFANEAQEIYIAAHKALAEGDTDKLHECVTERAFPLVTHETNRKTIRWQFLGSLEPPRVVHVRCTHLINKENVFAQATVRFHTKQTLAVYDRFGRLMHGSEVVARDVLEYVVFEKHVANTYGLWRIHDKIIPDWMPPREPVRRTFKVKDVEEEEEEPPPPPSTVPAKDATTESELEKDKHSLALA